MLIYLVYFEHITEVPLKIMAEMSMKILTGQFPLKMFWLEISKAYFQRHLGNWYLTDPVYAGYLHTTLSCVQIPPVVREADIGRRDTYKGVQMFPPMGRGWKWHVSCCQIGCCPAGSRQYLHSTPEKDGSPTLAAGVHSLTGWAHNGTTPEKEPPYPALYIPIYEVAKF